MALHSLRRAQGMPCQIVRECLGQSWPKAGELFMWQYLSRKKYCGWNFVFSLMKPYPAAMAMAIKRIVMKHKILKTISLFCVN